MIRVLLTGSNGQLGTEVCRWFSGVVELVAADRSRADLARPDSLVRLLRDVRPQLVVNAAAYTAVDRAESEESVAFMVNGEAPGVLADECRRLDAGLVHFSTDYVFDGAESRPYRETDPCHPLNAYGRTKLAGEKAVSESGAMHLILRVGWLYGIDGRNFVKSILHLARERTTLAVVNDQFGAPTWARTIAQWLRSLVAGEGAREEPPWRSHPGTYHVAPAGRATWFDVACTAIRVAEAHPLACRSLRTRSASVQAIATSAYPTAATRPPNSQLDADKARTLLSWPAPDWESDLVACVRLLLDRQALEGP